MPEALVSSPLAMALTALGVIVFLYLGRGAAHSALRVLTSALHDGLVHTANAIHGAQEKLGQRNREVLLEMGRESSERLIEREFHRVDAVVSRRVRARLQRRVQRLRRLASFREAEL